MKRKSGTGKIILLTLEVILLVYLVYISIPLLYLEVSADISMVNRKLNGTYTTQGKYGNIRENSYELQVKMITAKYELNGNEFET